MTKTKVIQAIIFSTLLFTIFLLGGLYAGGQKGAVLEGNVLTTEGKLGAGLISVGILVWFWTLAIFVQPLFKWQGKSNALWTLLVSTLVAFPITMIGGIVYLVMKLDKQEKITVKVNKMEEEAA